MCANCFDSAAEEPPGRLKQAQLADGRAKKHRLLLAFVHTQHIWTTQTDDSEVEFGLRWRLLTST